MDEDQRISRLEDKLDELNETVEDNNKMLKSLERTARWSFWGKLLLWIVILALPFIVFGPFVRALVPGLSSSDNHSLFGLPSQQQVKELLDAYKAGSSTPAR